MTNKPYTLKLGGVEKETRDTITVDWSVDNIGAFNASLKEDEYVRGFTRTQILRGGVQIFDGRVEKPSANYGSGGMPADLSGFDWTARLRDFLTTSQSIVDTDTATALDAIMSETDFLIDVEGEYEYITALEEWSTWIDFVIDVDFYYHATVEIDLTKDTWISQTVNDATDYTLPNMGLKGAFMYDGGTQHRLYLWARDTSNNIWYFHSTDGVTWTAVDSRFNAQSDAWSVGWSGSEVYLFYYDGANTDFSLGIVDNATGTIGWVLTTNNIFANDIRFGPVFDDNWDVWVIRNSGGGIAYESTDLGVTWNNRFGPGADELWGLAQVGSDGDMYGICLDTVDEDIEEWLWDRSAGTFAFTQKIADQSNINGLDVVQDAALNMYVTWVPGTSSIYLASNQSGGWLQATVTSTTSFDTFDTSCDGYNCYVFYGNAAGFQAKKYHSSDLLESWVNTSAQNPLIGTPHHLTTTRCYLQDGKVAIYCGVAGALGGDSLQSAIWEQKGARITEGETDGYFYTYAITASPAMTSWGILTADGVQIQDGSSVLWDIQNAAPPFQVLVDDETAPFDLDISGVDPAYNSIWIYCYLNDSGTDPYVYEFDITEKIDAVTIDTDYEDCFTAVRNLANLAGAEYYVTYDGTNWTLHFTTRRGEDKSDWLVFKTAKTGDEPSTVANIRVIDKQYDWSNYANVVLVKGSGGVVGSVRDNAEIDEMEQEYWISITDGDIITTSMARQRAYQELVKRNSVTQRISGEFIDKNDSNDVEIGDSVTLIVEWLDADLKIEGSQRIVKLRREGGTNGERVAADFSNKIKAAQYWNYIRQIDDHGRWITS